MLDMFTNPDLSQPYPSEIFMEPSPLTQSPAPFSSWRMGSGKKVQASTYSLVFLAINFRPKGYPGTH